jgi:acetyltransferase
MLNTIGETYRHIVTLGDGARMLLRPFVVSDAEAVTALYAAAQQEDVILLRDNLARPDVMKTWVEALDYNRVLPLLALINSRLAGIATLYRRNPPYDHVADVQIFLSKEFRRRGLGTEVLRTLIELARKEGLHWLQADIFVNQPKIIKAFEGLGFKRLCVFEDYVMVPDGHTEDIAVLTLRLLTRSDEF